MKHIISLLLFVNSPQLYALDWTSVRNASGYHIFSGTSGDTTDPIRGQLVVSCNSGQYDTMIALSADTKIKKDRPVLVTRILHNNSAAFEVEDHNISTTKSTIRIKDDMKFIKLLADSHELAILMDTTSYGVVGFKFKTTIGKQIDRFKLQCEATLPK